MEALCQCGHLDIQHTTHGCNHVIGIAPRSLGGIEQVCRCPKFTAIGEELLIPGCPHCGDPACASIVAQALCDKALAAEYYRRVRAKKAASVAAGGPKGGWRKGRKRGPRKKA